MAKGLPDQVFTRVKLSIASNAKAQT